MNKKIISIVLIIGGIAFATLRGCKHISVGYEYKSEISGYWELSDKSSTIDQKSFYLDKFISAIEKENLTGMNDALFYPNIDNSFDENFKALKSLQQRFKEISKMDEGSFAYQTAMQQITSQEQGEAKEMLSVISGCWEKKNHYTTWNIFIVLGFLIIQALMIMIGFIILEEDY